MEETADIKTAKAPNTFKNFFRLSKWAFLFSYKLEPKLFTLRFLFVVVNRSYPLIYSYLFAKVLDSAVHIATTSKDFRLLFPSLVPLAIYYLVSSVIGIASSIVADTLSLTVHYKVSRAFYTKLKDLGVQTLELPEVRNKIQRADDYISSIWRYSIDIISFIADVVRLIATVILVFKFSPLICVFIFIICIPAWLNDRNYRNKVYTFDREVTEDNRKIGGISNKLRDSDSLLEILVNDAFSYLDSIFYVFKDRMAGLRLKLFRKWQVSGRLIDLVIDALLLFSYLNPFSRFINGLQTIGTTSFQINLLDSFQSSMNKIFTAFNDMYEFSMRLQEAYEIFNMQPAYAGGTYELEKLYSGPKIEIKNVSFKYPNTEKFVFEHLNLNIYPGEKVALVGHNGAGKTTLVKLLGCVYKPQKGEILANDINLADMTLSSWYKNVSILMQEFNTYKNLTVKQNILLGEPNRNLDDSEIFRAAEQADALDFIEDLPNKFDTIPSSNYTGGVSLSSGQWQKLAIARFFYRNAPLVIFDEPTAAIDAVSEYNIFNRIYEFFSGKTVLIISHRFSTVRNADRIIVLEKGKIIEEGSHSELMEKNGYYANAFRLQAEGYSK